MRMRMCGRAAGGRRARVADHVIGPVRSSLFSSERSGTGTGVVEDRDIPASVSGKEGRDGLVVHAYLSKVGGVVAPARSARWDEQGEGWRWWREGHPQPRPSRQAGAAAPLAHARDPPARHALPSVAACAQ